MSYLSLRVVSAAIQLAAIATAFFVVVMFFVNIDRQYQARSNALALGRELQSNMTQLEALAGQFGISVAASDPLAAESLIEGLFNALTLKNFQDLFVGLVASLLIFGFGGIIRLLIDIAERDVQQEYAYYTKPDSELAPTAPNPWGSFPAKPDYVNKPIPAPPGTYDERLRNMQRR